MPLTVVAAFDPIHFLTNVPSLYQSKYSVSPDSILVSVPTKLAVGLWTPKSSPFFKSTDRYKGVDLIQDLNQEQEYGLFKKFLSNFISPLPI